MRSSREILFRLRQEAANAALSIAPAPQNLRAASPLAALPPPSAIADALRPTAYSAELIAIADQVLAGRVPIFATTIDYGATPAWRRDPLRGTETPKRYFRRIPYLDLGSAGDHKWIWELNRHQHLVLLAQAFVLTGMSAYCEQIFRQLEHWWAENPFQQGINWTSALEVGFRSLSWIWIWHLVGEQMSPPFRQRFLGELYRHGLHLEYNLSVYFSPNTHLLGEAVALHAIGRLFPEFPRAKRWRELGRETVREQMRKQVKADGSHFEQSTYYHVYALDFFLLHALLEDVTDEYRNGLLRMTNFLAAIVNADGVLPLLGDDDGGRLFHPYGERKRFARGTLATASLITGKAAFAYSERDAHEIAMWWLGPEKCREAVPPASERKSQAFADSGLVALHRGKISALFDAGPMGRWSAGHSHADALSLVVSVGGDEVLIDPGAYSYLDPEWREVFRGTAAHNTVRIDGRDQATPDGPFRWRDKPEVRLLEFSSTAERDRTVGVCRYGGVTHTRSVVLSEVGGFQITDELQGPPGEHRIGQFWHTGLAVTQKKPGVWRVGNVAELHVEGGECEQGWSSQAFGSKESAPVVVVRRTVTFPARREARLLVGG